MYRKLSKTEIEILAAQGCSAEDWNGIEVHEDFDASLVSGCRFEGGVRIGRRVRIRNIHETIANYAIEDDAEISNVVSLKTTGASTFGNGTAVAVLNETGGREVKIFENLTAQIAYISAMYRHRPATIEAIDAMADAEAAKRRSTTGTVGRGAKIANCGAVTNVNIGEKALIDGALELTGGTVGSAAEAPTHIGRGVIMRSFITASSAGVSDGAIIEKCFVGQGCEIGKSFTAENCLFFANSVMMCGEACSIFAGPYTVTHHKSTLLIGGMFSFFNAGSASNQSNHYYRLGPVHQGVLERGCKTASSSYMLFPARIGVFSIVKGRHNKNIDTSKLPFSYIVENGGESVVVPAANLVNAGAARDAAKWPLRDNRKGENILDLINFEMLNPYTVGEIIEGMKVLESLPVNDGQYVSYGNAKIKSSSVRKALDIYRLALDKYTGSVFAANSQAGHGKSFKNWTDIAGMIAPTDLINELLDKVDEKKIGSIESLSAAIKDIHNSTPEHERAYAAGLTTGSPIQILEKWKTSTAKINEMLCEDAKKEFSDDMKISYANDRDFYAVRGRFGDNAFVKGVAANTAETIETADRLIAKIRARNDR